MHLPQDPAEWLFMGAVMAVVMVIGMLAVHGVRSHLRGHGGAMGSGPVMHVGSRIIGWLLGLGLPIRLLGPMMLLTVRGRRSGLPRTLPVDVHDVDGRRYLIATHGVGAWVVNLRAAGEGSLRLGRARIPFTASELGAQEAGRIMRRALAPLVASKGWRGGGVRSNLGVSADAAEPEYVRAAALHPVFEVVPTNGSTRTMA